MAQLQATDILESGFLKLPEGNTSQRPSSPVVGDARFNTDTDKLEYYDGSLWKRATGGSVIATGGTVSQLGPYTRHVFTSTGNSTFAVTSAGYVDVLIVAGGGGAEDDAVDNGGGGGGGVVYRNRVFVTPQNYTITVGAGGAVGTGGRNSVGGFNGGNSSALGYTALGGGGGAPYAASGSAGGSGGGSSEDNASAVGGAATQPGATDVGYGNKGGDQPPRNNNEGGGGGGAGGPGGPAYPITGFANEPTYDTTIDKVGDGGIGWYFGGIFGADVGENGYFAGGGGGGGGSSSPANQPGGKGGLGGGGDGRGRTAADFPLSPSAGIDGTGGGGGGSANNAVGVSNGAGFRGGHGVVIIRYVR